MKILKKSLLLLFAVFTTIALFCFSANALRETGKCGDNVYWEYNSETKEVIISGTGDMYNDYFDYDELESTSPFYKSDICSVVIKYGVTSVANCFFENCERLSDVSFPDTLTTIGGSAFAHCTGIQNIVIPDSVTTIKNRAFMECSSIRSLTIGDSVTIIDDYAFYGCSSLENVIIPDNVSNIGTSVFKNCTGLKSVKIGDGLSNIGSSTFLNCNNLQYVTIGNNVDRIGDSLFENCTSLQSIIIPDRVTFIHYDAFKDCTSLKSITIGKELTTVYDGAFKNCKNLTDVYYKGTQEDWNKIKFQGWNKVNSTGTNKYLLLANIHFHTHNYTVATTPATLTANGKTEYKCSCGDIQKTETIAKVSSLTLSTTKYIYDGKNKTPKLTVKDANGKTLVKNTDYKITVASKRAGIGRYTVKVTFMGNYSGSKNLFFYILPGKPATVKSASQSTYANKLTWSAVPGAVGYTVYRYSPSKKAYVKAGTTEGTTLTVSKLLTGTKYTFRVVAYGKTASGKVYDSETYALLKSATKTKTPELTKVTASSTKGKTYVYHTDVKGETGYTVYYSTSKTTGFKKYANFKADTTRCDITKLTSGKTYYFKVRTYIKTDSGYVYSPWSAVKGVKVK